MSLQTNPIRAKTVYILLGTLFFVIAIPLTILLIQIGNFKNDSKAGLERETVIISPNRNKFGVSNVTDRPTVVSGTEYIGGDAIQSAINAGAKTIQLKSGEYTFNNYTQNPVCPSGQSCSCGVVIKDKQNIVIESTSDIGMSIITRDENTGKKSAFCIVNSTVTFKKIVVKNFKENGEAFRIGYSAGQNYDNSSFVSLLNVGVDSNTNGVAFAGNAGAKVVIKNSIFENIDSVALINNGNSTMSVENSVFYNNKTPSSFSKSGNIWVGFNAITYISNNYFYGNEMLLFDSYSGTSIKGEACNNGQARVIGLNTNIVDSVMAKVDVGGNRVMSTNEGLGCSENVNTSNTAVNPLIDSEYRILNTKVDVTKYGLYAETENTWHNKFRPLYTDVDKNKRFVRQYFKELLGRDIDLKDAEAHADYMKYNGYKSVISMFLYSDEFQNRFQNVFKRSSTPEEFITTINRAIFSSMDLGGNAFTQRVNDYKNSNNFDKLVLSFLNDSRASDTYEKGTLIDNSGNSQLPQVKLSFESYQSTKLSLGKFHIQFLNADSLSKNNKVKSYKIALRRIPDNSPINDLGKSGSWITINTINLDQNLPLSTEYTMDLPINTIQMMNIGAPTGINGSYEAVVGVSIDDEYYTGNSGCAIEEVGKQCPGGGTSLTLGKDSSIRLYSYYDNKMIQVPALKVQLTSDNKAIQEQNIELPDKNINLEFKILNGNDFILKLNPYIKSFNINFNIRNEEKKIGWKTIETKSNIDISRINEQFTTNINILSFFTKQGIGINDIGGHFQISVNVEFNKGQNKQFPVIGYAGNRYCLTNNGYVCVINRNFISVEHSDAMFELFTPLNLEILAPTDGEPINNSLNYLWVGFKLSNNDIVAKYKVYIKQNNNIIIKEFNNNSYEIKWFKIELNESFKNLGFVSGSAQIQILAYDKKDTIIMSSNNIKDFKFHNYSSKPSQEDNVNPPTEN